MIRLRQLEEVGLKRNNHTLKLDNSLGERSRFFL